MKAEALASVSTGALAAFIVQWYKVNAATRKLILNNEEVENE